MSSIKYEKDRLISLVFAENQIWNQKHDKYHNRDEKILIWTRIATNLGTTGNALFKLILIIKRHLFYNLKIKDIQL